MPRDAKWLEIVKPLQDAYARDGRAALAKMKPIEVLALHNEKIHDLNVLMEREKEPMGELTLLKEKLVREANDIADWSNANQRRLREKHKDMDIDMD